jgi:transposase
MLIAHKIALDPQFRKKGVHDRFTLTNDQFSIDGSRIRIPHLGWVRMRESLRFTGKLMSATLSRVADRRFVSLAVDTPDLSHLPKAQGRKPRRGGCGPGRVRAGNALDGRAARAGAEGPHGLAAPTPAPVASSEPQAERFHEFRRQLEYKAAMRGGQVVVAERWFASSKTCSCCGHQHNDMALSVRHWACPLCGTEHDRDRNAAINLRNYAVSSTVSACGGEGAGLGGNAKVKPAPAKQEVSTKSAFV